MKWSLIPALLLTAFTLPLQSAPPKGEISAADYTSIQEAIDANPGRMIYVPPGDYEISDKLRLHTDNGGLHGSGRIIQTNPKTAIIKIDRATGVRVSGVTLTRPEGKMDTESDGVIALQCHGLLLDDVRVLDNRSASSGIALRNCRDSQVRNCVVENYSGLAVDDRTANAHYGYAFKCINGTGINTDHCSCTLIQGCRIVERHLLPTQEMQKQFELGKIVKKNPVKGDLIAQVTWDADAVEVWHQGSALVVNAPEDSDYTQVLGNYIENAGQGMDIHADHVTISQNIVNNATIGMKAMHGSRNVIITGNQFSKMDLWAIGLMPGTASHPAVDGKPETANADGGSIVANNIISDFGRGNTHWIWGDKRSPFKFDKGQEADDPPLTDVIISGNIVYAIGPPLYKYAVVIHPGPNTPQGLHFSNNILHPGTGGIANQELPP